MSNVQTSSASRPVMVKKAVVIDIPVIILVNIKITNNPMKSPAIPTVIGTIFSVMSFRVIVVYTLLSVTLTVLPDGILYARVINPGFLFMPDATRTPFFEPIAARLKFASLRCILRLAISYHLLKNKKGFCNP